MFVGITLLFLDFSGIMRHYVGWMPRLQLLEAVLALNVVVVAALVVPTLVFGRIYCSVVCPLGVMQDIIAWVGRRVSKHRYSYSKELRWLRYSVLAMLVAVAAGVLISLAAVRWDTPRSCRSRDSVRENSDVEAMAFLL